MYSSKVATPASFMSSPVMAWTDTGMSWVDSARLVAVTTTSSICPAAAATAMG